MLKNSPIKKVQVQNFKSLRDIKFDCKRVNIFLGKPNVGKSNILEALTLLDISYCQKLTDVVRYDNLLDLFYLKNTNNSIIVETDSNFFSLTDPNAFRQHFKAYYILKNISIFNELKKHLIENRDLPNTEYSLKVNTQHQFTNKQGNDLGFVLDSSGNSFNSTFYDQNLASKVSKGIKNYIFDSKVVFNTNSGYKLIPPFGDNLLTVIEFNKEISDEFSKLTSEYGLDLFIDNDSKTYYFIKRMNNIFYRYDKKLIADTFKRYIFYYAAIKSNEDSIILFEEPESNCYPNYIIKLALEMMESKNNQFFVTTHSPHLVRELFNHEMRNDLAVHICSFDKDTQETKIRTLTNHEVQDLHEADADLLLNLSDYEA